MNKSAPSAASHRLHNISNNSACFYFSKEKQKKMLDSDIATPTLKLKRDYPSKVQVFKTSLGFPVIQHSSMFRKNICHIPYFELQSTSQIMKLEWKGVKKIMDLLVTGLFWFLSSISLLFPYRWQQANKHRKISLTNPMKNMECRDWNCL